MYPTRVLVPKSYIKLLAIRLQVYIQNNDISNPLQSAYTKHHSVESALLNITITNRLSDLYGMSAQTQIWFSSYLKNRQQSVTRGQPATIIPRPTRPRVSHF